MKDRLVGARFVVAFSGLLAFGRQFGVLGIVSFLYFVVCLPVNCLYRYIGFTFPTVMCVSVYWLAGLLAFFTKPEASMGFKASISSYS